MMDAKSIRAVGLMIILAWTFAFFMLGFVTCLLLCQSYVLAEIDIPECRIERVIDGDIIVLVGAEHIHFPGKIEREGVDHALPK